MSYNNNFYKTQPIILEKPIVDNNKIIYYLTLSVILEYNNAINEMLKLQNKLLQNIQFSDIVQHGIYKYPSERIHFSLINFKDLSSSNYDNITEYQDKMQDKINIIKKTLKKIDNIEKPKNKKIKVGFIHTKESKSIAIQAFLNDDLAKYIKNIQSNLVKKLKNEGIGLIDIKGFRDEGFIGIHRFGINLVRFFREPNSREYENLVKIIKEINQQSSKKLIMEFDLKKINFVISDNWLSNKIYDLECSIKL